MNSPQKKAVLYAISAALLYAINSPLSKLLLERLPPTIMAALLYLGTGIGMSYVWLFWHKHAPREEPLTKKQLPLIFAMLALDVGAPVFLMLGLRLTSAANASLLNNFEIVVTSLVAYFFFREVISRRLALAILLVTLSSLILSFEDMSSFSFSIGSVFVLLACVCWGIENNCTRALSGKNPLAVVILNGFGSGTATLLIALLIGERTTDFLAVLLGLLLGFLAFGLSIFFYILAQRRLGAAKTSAYYALAPFIGAALGLILFREPPGVPFLIALPLMIAGAVLASRDNREP